MHLTTLLTPLLLAPLSQSTHIILPLYLYPGDSGSAWSPITTVISSHTSTQFTVVINPNTGPGTTSSFPPDANQAAGISKLNSFPNARVIGYVETLKGSKSIADVNKEVDVYASWSGGNKINGIYFDDVSKESSLFSYYQQIADHARQTTGFVGFNPGTIAPEQLFSYCDLMVEFEASLADFQSQQPVNKIPEQYREKSAFQIYSTPEGTDVKSIVDGISGEGVGAVYMGVDCCYKEWSPKLLGGLADAVGGSGGGGGSGSSTPSTGSGGGASSGNGTVSSGGSRAGGSGTGASGTGGSGDAASGGSTSGNSGSGNSPSGNAPSGNAPSGNAPSSNTPTTQKAAAKKASGTGASPQKAAAVDTVPDTNSGSGTDAADVGAKDECHEL